MAEFFKPNKPGNANAKTRRNALIGKYRADLERFNAAEGERTRLETEVAQAEKVYDDAVKVYTTKPEGVPIPTVEQIRSLMKLRGAARYALMAFNWMNPQPLAGGKKTARRTRRHNKHNRHNKSRKL